MDNAPTILVDFHANVPEDIPVNDATLKLVLHITNNIVHITMKHFVYGG